MRSATLLLRPLGKFLPLGSNVHKSNSVLQPSKGIRRTTVSLNLARPSAPTDGLQRVGAQDEAETCEKDRYEGLELDVEGESCVLVGFG